MYTLERFFKKNVKKHPLNVTFGPQNGYYIGKEMSEIKTFNIETHL